MNISKQENLAFVFLRIVIRFITTTIRKPAELDIAAARTLYSESGIKIKFTASLSTQEIMNAGMVDFANPSACVV